VRRIFDHYVYMLGRNPRRCKLDPTRKSAILAALTVYDEDTLMLTMEGIAADPLDGKPESMRAAMRELEWLLARGARIERWADKGEALRQELDRADAQQQHQIDTPSPPSDPAAAAASRERLRTHAAAMRGTHA
jgi:hypothetical protein